jgi:hypothetical protein
VPKSKDFPIKFIQTLRNKYIQSFKVVAWGISIVTEKPFNNPTSFKWGTSPITAVKLGGGYPPNSSKVQSFTDKGIKGKSSSKFKF